MALWDSLTSKTSKTVLNFNKMVNEKTIDAVARTSGLTYAILGKRYLDTKESETQVNFERMSRITGTKQAIRFLGAYSTMAAPTDGAQEYAAATGQYSDSYWGESVFDLCHLTLHEILVASNLMLIGDDTKKGAAYLTEVQQMIQGTVVKKITDGLLSAVAPARGAIGGIKYAVDDGANTSAPAGSATGGTAGYSTYGELLRATAENAIFCPYVGGSTGEMTIPKITSAVVYAGAAGGNVRVCPVGPTLYQKAHELAQAYVQTSYDKEWDRFGGKRVNLCGVDFVLEGGTYGPTDVLTFIDPDTWAVYMNNAGINVQFRDRNDLEDAKEAFVSLWFQALCKAPWKNSKLTGVTA